MYAGERPLMSKQPTHVEWCQAMENVLSIVSQSWRDYAQSLEAIVAGTQNMVARSKTSTPRQHQQPVQCSTTYGDACVIVQELKQRRPAFEARFVMRCAAGNDDVDGASMHG